MDRLISDIHTHPRTFLFALLVCGMFAVGVLAEIEAEAAAPDEWGRFWGGLFRLTSEEWEELGQAADEREQPRRATWTGYVDHWDALAHEQQGAS